MQPAVPTSMHSGGISYSKARIIHSIAGCYRGLCYLLADKSDSWNSDEASLSEINGGPKTTKEALALAEGLAGSLNRKLAVYRDHTARLVPQVADAYDRLVERLERLDRDEIGPQVGEAMPGFFLPDQQGRLVSLQSLIDAGPVVVTFNRGHWCPYCKLDLRSLAAVHDEIARLGAKVVSIMPDTAQFTKSSADQNQLPFPILSDVDLGYSLALGLVYWIGAETTRLYQSIGLDLERYQGNGSYFLPIAAKFVVGRDGLVKARHVDIEFRKRMEPDAIVEVLKSL
jgi:peroxiredoxin